MSIVTADILFCGLGGTRIGLGSGELGGGVEGGINELENKRKFDVEGGRGRGGRRGGVFRGFVKLLRRVGRKEEKGSDGGGAGGRGGIGARRAFVSAVWIVVIFACTYTVCVCVCMCLCARMDVFCVCVCCVCMFILNEMTQICNHNPLFL